MHRKRLCEIACGALAFLMCLTSMTPWAAKAQDHHERAARESELPLSEGVGSEVELSDEVRDSVEEPLESVDPGELDPETAERLAEAAESYDEGGAPPEAMPLALPSGEAKSAVTPQSISLPDAEGSIEGMGESFSPVLSSGTGTFSVPIALPPGRAGVQPSLALSYGTSAGNSDVGFGWSLGVPFISRQTDRGLPHYVDAPGWHPEEDRFIYNGGQELVPVDNDEIAAVDNEGGDYRAEALPSDVDTGWQQYRARVEGGFMRFFRSPNSTRWIVQSKDGTRFDFGLLPADEVPTDLDTRLAVQTEDAGGMGPIFRWCLTRMSDAHGSTVYYRYFEDEGQRYLSDVFYISPHAECGAPTTAEGRRECGAPLSRYGARVQLQYERREDVFTSYIAGWRIATALRLRRIVVTAAERDAGQRYLVRRYHLTYQLGSYHSLLSKVQVEGRASSRDPVRQVQVFELTREEDIPDAPVGETLPAMVFRYSEPPNIGVTVPGFGGIDATVHDVASSPPHSVDEARSDLFDVNSDGLPDLIVTDPARYRTRSGDPAVGVFFNGFTGAGASPAAAAGTFSDAVPMPMRSDLSGTMNLGNLNIVPMDIDGDGRSDLLHMPRRRTYGWFTPTRAADGPIAEVSPADQGWEWTYAEIDLPAEDTDPRIDFGRDGQHIKVLDVNNDHLIDVVRTTGTVMQTWLNLGWLPGGEGRFGSYRHSDGAWELSTEPLESCILHDGLPLDFEDPEVRLADMNGDGIQDIVKIRRGRLVWWPGRGEGVWGEGSAECDRGEGAGRGIHVVDPPAELNVELDGVYLSDINADGAADVVQVRFDAVDVWFNRAGESFTERITRRGVPYAPGFAPRIRFADIDGSGTGDIIWGNAHDWQYIDPMGGQRPRLLVGVENGLGAVTDLEYGSSAEDYLRDLQDADTCRASDCERFTWSHVRGACDDVLLRLAGQCRYRSGGSPVVSTVVRDVQTSDQFDLLGREENVTRTEYAYHDGYYEGIEQEFRGFGAADARAIGDPYWHPTGTTRTHFRQGRRPTAIAGDRLADNPNEALKARAFLTETFNDYGEYLSTSHSGYVVRHLLTGLDGRAVSYAFVGQTDEIRYDVGGWAPGGMEVPGLFSVQREAALSTDVTVEPADPVTVRGAGYAHIRNTTDLVDNVGNVLQQTAHGRIRGEFGETPPEAERLIVNFSEPILKNGEEWIWRTRQTHVEGHGGGGQDLGRTTNTFNATGDLLHSVQRADLPTGGAPAYAFEGDGEAERFDQRGQDIEASTTYDPWGNALTTCAGSDLGTYAPAECFRFATVAYDDAYAQLPVVEQIAVDMGPGSPRIGSDAFRALETGASWDRGFGVLLTATDPNAQETTVGYDGLGRLTFLAPPAGSGCASAGSGSDVPPLHRFEYELVPGMQPVNVIHATRENDCTGVGAGQLRTRTYVDGLGRTRGSLLAAEGPPVRWVQSGVTQFTRRGQAFRAFQPSFLPGADPTPSEAVSLPSQPHVESVFDAFDRQLIARAEDGAETVTSYHALSTTVWDPLDLYGDPRFSSTPAITRMDGHGRVIDQLLWNRQPGVSDDEFYRLVTRYRADGSVLELTRAQTSGYGQWTGSVPSGKVVRRQFFYDTAGRRIGSNDPDTNAPGKSDGERTWRYLFNKVGDLVAVRDPRGCGQNFYYDHGGRLIGEDYVTCAEAQVAGDSPDESVPSDAIALESGTSGGHEVDARYYFDAPPPWEADLEPEPSRARPSMAFHQGRLTATSDRGQRSMLAYDARGNVVWSARQMAVIPQEVALDSETLPANAHAADVVETPAPVGTRVFDPTTYVQTFSFDHADRPTSTQLPRDPDWATLLDDMGYEPPFPDPPVVTGHITYNERSLPDHIEAQISGTPYPITDELTYSRDGLVEEIIYGDAHGSRDPTTTRFRYDDRRRLVRTWTERDPTSPPDPTTTDLSEVTRPVDQTYEWDAANNLTAVIDGRLPEEWPAGHRPPRIRIGHDALYRVTSADYDYRHADGSWTAADDFTDWRRERTEPNADPEVSTHEAADPMREEPAPMVIEDPDGRVVNLTYQYDWLANMVEWTDDAHAFYERSIGDIENGFDDYNPSTETGKRPSALYLSSDLGGPSENRGGYVELDYGEGGNVVAMTVHGQCTDAIGETCGPPTGSTIDDRRADLRTRCECAKEQHYRYRWDELNRLSEARRYDRGGTGDFELAVRQRYRYDGGNQRTIKQTIENDPGDPDPPRRSQLYVYPGDYVRSGVQRDTNRYLASGELGTETQYLIGGARIVWKTPPPSALGLDRDVRITYALTDLIQSTSAVIDLYSGELLETATFYPNGGQETHLTQHEVSLQPEPFGFTGKESDDEVGVVYFGQRYLISRIGRWSSPDPLQVHSGGGGEASNSYHYVAGNVLQARDPVGLQEYMMSSEGDATDTRAEPDPERAMLHRRAPPGTLSMGTDRGERHLTPAAPPSDAPPNMMIGRWFREWSSTEGAGRNFFWLAPGSSEAEFIGPSVGGARATGDTDYAVDVLSLGSAFLIRRGGRLILGSVVRRAGQEGADAAASLAVRRAQAMVLDAADRGVESTVRDSLERILRHVDDIQREAIDSPEILTRWLRPGERPNGLTPTNWGHALEEELARRIEADDALSEAVSWTERSSAPHDFVFRIGDRTINLELTTFREAADHAQRESVDLLIMYERPPASDAVH